MIEEQTLNTPITEAPGRPGVQAHWSSGAKSGIGKALHAPSRVTFTISHGIVNEVYFPREDIVCINEAGFIVTDGKEFFSEERKDTFHDIRMYADGIPAYRLSNRCKQNKYLLEKEIVADPIRDSLLQLISFKSLEGTIDNYHLFVFISPHIKNSGNDNSGWTGKYKGVPMLFAEKENVVLAVACSTPWKKKSVGFKGFSDGFSELTENNS